MIDDGLGSIGSKIWPHIIELRQRFIYCVFAFLIVFVGCYLYAAEIYGFLVKPLAEIMSQSPGDARKMIYTGLTEAFFTYVKVSFWAAFFICFPFFLIQIWLFIAPGLYKDERKEILPFLIVTPILFLCGGAFVYYFIFPMAWSFFLSFETPQMAVQSAVPIMLEAKVSEYLSLVMTLILAFGFSFELPVVLVLLMRIGVLDVSFLIKIRRYAIVFIFIIAAILTPPDIISQIALAIPLLFLYEVSIVIGKLQAKKQR